MGICPGGVEYTRVDMVDHRAQWTACTREGTKEGSKGCLFRLDLPFSLKSIVFPFRLKSSSEQEDVKEGMTYCIIIQENQQIGSPSECCIPKVMKLANERLIISFD